MGNWKPMPQAPRADADGKPVPVQLFLPGAAFVSGADGRPTEVRDVTCVGVFDVAQQHWVDEKSGHRVYPSQWQELSA